jgi:hypothetical protein
MTAPRTVPARENEPGRVPPLRRSELAAIYAYLRPGTVKAMGGPSAPYGPGTWSASVLTHAIRRALNQDERRRDEAREMGRS